MSHQKLISFSFQRFYVFHAYPVLNVPAVLFPVLLPMQQTSMWAPTLIFGNSYKGTM